jgi:uncharacterized coiled-coil DUF342 family protein
MKDIMAEEQVTELDRLFQELKQKKEGKFRISQKLRENIAAIRELRQKRMEHINQARSSKAEREKLKENVKGLVTKLKDIRKEKEKINAEETPGALKSRIKKIEWKIQTEVMPYDKEKQLVKVRKELEKKLEPALKVSAARKDESITRSELANKIFEEQLKHENMIKFSKNSEELWQGIKNISDEITENKAKMKQLNDEITSIKTKIGELKSAENAGMAKVADVQKKNVKEELNKKLKEVKEKFSKSKKLTTEDIILLQAAKEDEISF